MSRWWPIAAAALLVGPTWGAQADTVEIIQIYGILGELSNPGAVLPGVAGAIALILALYMAAILPLNIAGVALTALAIGLFVADVFAPTHGVLTAGGIISFFLGALMLFDRSAPGFRLSLSYIIPATVITAAFFVFVVGQVELDELLAHREKINRTLQEILDRQTDPWGIKVTAVEVRDVVLPDNMKRAMAKQAETERERRAKIINAEGEFQAADKLVQAARMISTEPVALQLRFLQTMREIASEHNTTTILPVPIDIFSPLLKKPEGHSGPTVTR